MSDASNDEKKTTTRARFERRLSHRPEKVWRALTEARELAHWFPASMEGANDHGAPLRFTFPDGKSPTLTGEITEYDPPRALAYTMGDEKLRWELSPIPEGCLLVFTTEVTEDERASNDTGDPRACADRFAA
jgi:uncharacterized protein YndB with AHSA1/START domain